MSSDDRAKAVQAVLEQMDKLCEYYVFYGVGDGSSSYGVADGQPSYVTAGLLSEANDVERARQNRDIAMSVHNAMLAAAKEEKAEDPAEQAS
jgi:hypothetical protein